MELYLIPVFIGFSIMIVGSLSLWGIVIISPTYILSVSIAGLAFAFAGFFEEQIKIEGKTRFTSFAVHALYFFAIFALVAFPPILENFKIGDKLKVVSDSFAIASIGMVVISLGTREIVKQVAQWRKRIEEQTKEKEISKSE